MDAEWHSQVVNQGAALSPSWGSACAEHADRGSVSPAAALVAVGWPILPAELLNTQKRRPRLIQLPRNYPSGDPQVPASDRLAAAFQNTWT